MSSDLLNPAAKSEPPSADEPAVRVENLTKTYRIYHSSVARALAPFRRTDPAKPFHALKDVTVDFPKGEVIAVLGKNGSGKSTLLKMIAGVTTPTSGRITVTGRVSAMLELTSGFDPELTGLDNIYLRALALGIPRDETEARRAEIVAFADIGEHIDQPVRTYSSGMKSRLGFAVSVSVEPDILIVDEVLAVGDDIFKLKCIDKMQQIRQAGKTILFVSHALGTVKAFCTKAIWINEGRLVDSGDVGPVMLKYKDYLKAERGALRTAASQAGEELGPLGKSDVLSVSGFRMFTSEGRKTRQFSYGEDIWFEFDYEVKRPIERLTFNFSLADAGEHEIFTSDKQSADNVVASTAGKYHLRVRLPHPRLLAGNYTLSGELWNNDAGFFVTHSRKRPFAINQPDFLGTGITHIDHELFNEPITADPAHS